MNGESMLVLAAMIATGLLPCLLPLHIVNLSHSKFRSRLWLLRDDLVDDLIFERLQPRYEAKRLLAIIEAHIHGSGKQTFADVAVAVAIYHDAAMPSLTDELLDEKIPPDERARLTQILDEFLDACRKHLISGSPSGWFAYLSLKVRGAISHLRPGERRDGWSKPDKQIQRAVRFEATEMPRLTSKRKVRDGSELVGVGTKGISDW
jgi:hypothetical protein